MNILISTVTPCFRMKKYLKKFLDELPKQTMFENLEVILDNNEPDEEEIRWVKEFQDKYPGRLKHIIVPKVDPIGISMNRCIKESTGEYLAMWNVDDLRTSNSIELQYNLLKENPSAGIAYGDYKVVRSFGVIDGEIVEHSKYSDNELTRSMIIGPFFMFRKSLCEKVGYFDEQLKSGADFDFAIRLSFSTKAIRTKECLGYYLNEGLGASTRPNSLQVLERVMIELRYGIYDKIDYDYLAMATSSYNIPYLLEFGEWKKVESFVSKYKEIILNRKKKWFTKGLLKYSFMKIFFIKEIKNYLKKILKPILIK